MTTPAPYPDILHRFTRREQSIDIKVFESGEVIAQMQLGNLRDRVPFALEEAFERELRQRGAELDTSGPDLTALWLPDVQRQWRGIVECIEYWFGAMLRSVGLRAIKPPPRRPRARLRRLAERLLNISGQIAARNQYILTKRQQRQLDFELAVAGIPQIASLEWDRARFVQEPLVSLAGHAEALRILRQRLLKPGDRAALFPAEAALLLPQSMLREFRDPAGRTLAEALAADGDRRYGVILGDTGELMVMSRPDRA